MNSRYAWILPLLVGALLASLVWWMTTEPEQVLGLERNGVAAEGLSPGMQDSASSSSTEVQGLQPGDSATRTQAADRQQAGVPQDAARLRVRLIDAGNGQAMSGIRVVAYRVQSVDGKRRPSMSTDNMRGSLQKNPVTNAEGWVEFDLPPRVAVRLSVRPDANTHQPLFEDILGLEPYEQRELVLSVHGLEYTPYFGLVRNRSNGEALANASVYVYPRQALQDDGLVVSSFDTPAAYTDASGIFQVDASKRGAIAWVQGPGCSPTLFALDATHDNAKLPREVYLSPNSWLAIILKDDRGIGMEDVVVQVSTSTQSLVQNESEAIPNTGVIWRATSDRFGRTEFPSLPSDVSLHVGFDFGTDSVVAPPPSQILNPGEARELEWIVGSGTRIAGQLYGNKGLPIAGQELWLMAASTDTCKLTQASDQGRALHKTHSDGEGRFVFSGVPAGSWWISPASLGTETKIAPIARRYDVGKETSELPIRYEVFPAEWVQGKVLNEDGSPAPNRTIWLQSVAVPGVLQVPSHADGSFRIGPLAPGLVEVGVRGRAKLPALAPVVCDAGEKELVLTLSTATKLTALVATNDKSPLPELEQILLSHPDGTVSEESALEWNDLAPGNYGISVLAKDGRVASTHRVGIGTRVGSGQVILHLAKGCEVHLKGPGQYRLWSGGACVGFGKLKAGDERTVTVPIGALRLDRPDSTKPAEPLEAKRGSPLHIDLGRSSNGPGLAPTRNQEKR